MHSLRPRSRSLGRLVEREPALVLPISPAEYLGASRKHPTIGKPASHASCMVCSVVPYNPRSVQATRHWSH